MKTLTNTTAQPGVNENLAGKIKHLEDVSHMIAHNLRGGTANIKMLAEMLMQTVEKNQAIIDDNTNVEDANDNELLTAQQAIAYIHESSSSIIDTLDTLMEVTEVQLNEDIKNDDCDIVEIVGGIINQLHGFVHQKKAVIDFNLAITSISYPKAYMESMLYNFINNALKYSRPDVPLKITISAYLENNRPVITVKDNGLGMDLEKYGGRIFNLKQVFHPGYESKGVGLYITRTQIESLGGHITVKSAVNEGSEFIVIL